MDSKYLKYLEETEQPALLDKLFELVKERKFEEAYGVAMRMEAVKDVKWQLKKLEE